MNKVLYVGMDVHKESIVVATAEGVSGEVDMFGTLPNSGAAVDKLLAKLSSGERKPRFVYEAGPCGYWLARYIRSKGFPCMVAAPSLIPKKSGDRIKTDSRDARNLARLYRTGDLTEVHVPSERSESMRDLVRCREDAVDDAKRAKQRLKAFLLRHGHFYPMKTRWSGAYVQWVRDLNMEDPVLRAVKEEYLETAIERQGRVEQIEEAIQTHAAQWESAYLVKIYRGFKGVSDRIAVMLAAELEDMKRFRKAEDLWAYLGLTPSEHSSGKKVQRGGITKAGPVAMRRALVEAAWTYTREPKISGPLIKRQEELSEHVKEVSWKAQNRLYGRYHNLVKRHMKPQKAVTAVARELCGFLWAAHQEAPAS